MRQSKFTETQIAAILQDADAGRPVNEIWRQYGISSATYYKWKAKVRWLGGLGCEAAEGIGAGEQLPQTDVRRLVPGESGAQWIVSRIFRTFIGRWPVLQLRQRLFLE